MPSRPPLELRSLARLLALLAGSTLSAGLMADDGGAAGMVTTAPKQPAAKDGKSAAPEPNDKEQRAKDAELLNDFVHYILIDRADAAKAMGQGLLDRGFSGTEFTKLVDSTTGYKRFSDAVARAGRTPSLEAVAGALLKAYEGGQLEQARDPAAIQASIQMLSGDLRQRSVARERLLFAGEYAVPKLFATYFSGADVATNAEIRRILVELGRHSIMPLVTALPKLNPTQQEQVCLILGDLPQTQSLPFLYDLASTTQSDSVRNAAQSAIHAISGAVNTQMPLAERYSDLADAYLKGSPSLMTFPNDAHQLVWEYQPGTGLTFQGVDTRVFPQTMAMQMSERALMKDPASSRAVSTWIAANLSRELRSPEGYENPVYGKDRHDAMYYAVAAGPGVGQNVLGKALDAGDTPLVRRALAALEKTAGRDLWKAYQDPTVRKPLLEALKYPNRRVQYEAALAIGTAQPKDPFEGAPTVVRTLGSSIRQASAKYALVVAPTTELQQTASELLRKNGFTVLPPATSIDEVRQAIADSPGVDVILANRLPSQQTGDLIAQSQSDARLRATPILAVVTPQGRQDLYPRYARDVRVRLLTDGAGPKDVETSVMELIDAASGGLITGDEAEAYKTRSLGVLRDLAMAGSPILSVVEAQGPLIGAVAESKGDTKARIAEVLSLIATSQAQVALTDAALAAEGAERAKLLGYVADSAKRFGNMLEARQVQALVSLTSKAAGDEATAAAAVVGALNLEGSGVVPLILGADK
ncbi:MAG TPA: hypothetical protein PKE29_01980 [Phycisphaerales bacterium]|nr:hypothetical protein [Phycisphaerales bacterium]